MTTNTSKNQSTQKRQISSQSLNQSEDFHGDSLIKDVSPEARLEQQVQSMADNSSHVQHTMQLQSMANGTIFSPESKPEELDKDSILQTKPGSRRGLSMAPPPSEDHHTTGLPDTLRASTERLSGMDLSDVRVHYNSDMPTQLNAHAYAQGSNIHIAPGQEKHLPHEAWHVVQQKQGRVKPTMQLKGKIKVNDDSALEREADVMGDKAIRGADADLVNTQLHFNKNTVERSDIFQRKLKNLRKTDPQAWIAMRGTSRRILDKNNLLDKIDLEISKYRGFSTGIPDEEETAEQLILLGNLKNDLKELRTMILAEETDDSLAQLFDVTDLMSQVNRELQFLAPGPVEEDAQVSIDLLIGLKPHGKKPEVVMVTGLSHLVKRNKNSIFEGDEGREIVQGQQLIIDKRDALLSRRGPNQEAFRAEDRTGAHHYRWYKVVSVDGIPVPSKRYVRSDVFVPLPAEMEQHELTPTILKTYLLKGGTVALAQMGKAQAKAANVPGFEEKSTSRIKQAIQFWYDEVNGNVQTTPEAGYPALLTVIQDSSTIFGGLHDHVKGEGDKLTAEAVATSQDSDAPSDGWADAAEHATGIADSLAFFGESYKAIKSHKKAKKATTQAGKKLHSTNRTAAVIGAGKAALNSAKYFFSIAGPAMGASIVGGIASLASYVHNLYQMGEAEEQYFKLRAIKVKDGHARLNEVLKYVKGKKGRRTVKKGIATGGAAISTGLSAGTIAALAIGGTAAAAALAVTPVGLALGGIALTIGLGLAAYKIIRWAYKKKKGRGDERANWGKYLHEKIAANPNMLQTTAKYKKDICLQIVGALGLTEEECKGPEGLKNITNRLVS